MPYLVHATRLRPVFGGVPGKKAAKPPTAVRDCVSTFVGVKPQGIFIGHLGTILPARLANKTTDIIDGTSGHLRSSFQRPKQTRTKLFLCPNITRAEVSTYL